MNARDGTILLTLATLLLAARPACAQDPKAVLLPLTAEDVGAGMAEMVQSVVAEQIAALEIAVVMGGQGSEDEAGADFVISGHLGRDGETYTISLKALDVAAGTSKQARAEADKSGLLSAASKLVAEILPAPDPCKDVDCSGHGICLVEGETPYCECDVGYRVDGLECKRHEVKKTPQKKWLELDPSDGRSIKGLVGSGFIFTLASLGTNLGAYVSLCIFRRPNGEERPSETATGKAWVGLQIAGLSTHAIGIPLLLASALKLRKSLGLRPATGQNVSGWVLYGVAAATMGMSFWPKVSFAMSTVTIPVIIACAWLSFYEAGSALEVARAGRMEKERASLVFPFVSPLPGGVSAGVGGVF